MIPLINVLSVVVLARYAPNSPAKVKQVLVHLLRNPFIWACALGVAVNVAGLPLPKVFTGFVNVLGQASLPLGLMIVGAGLDLKTAAKIDAAVLVQSSQRCCCCLRSRSAPAISRRHGPALAVIAIASSVPSAPNGYMLARQMGGDAPLLARHPHDPDFRGAGFDPGRAVRGCSAWPLAEPAKRKRRALARRFRKPVVRPN